LRTLSTKHCAGSRATSKNSGDRTRSTNSNEGWETTSKPREHQHEMVLAWEVTPSPHGALLEPRPGTVIGGPRGTFQQFTVRANNCSAPIARCQGAKISYQRAPKSSAMRKKKSGLEKQHRAAVPKPQRLSGDRVAHGLSQGTSSAGGSGDPRERGPGA
jgi:hypothetical protein